MAASAYIDPVADPSGPLTAADTETIFRKSAGRLGRDRVCKRLHTKGFPHPFERGLWSAKAVADWLPSAGRMESRSGVMMSTGRVISFPPHQIAREGKLRIILIWSAADSRKRL